MSTGREPRDVIVPQVERTHVPRTSNVGYILLGIIVIGYFLIRIGYRDIPLERDEGTYVYMGWSTLNGGTPYVDFFELKPPGLYYSYAFLHAISAGDLGAMHVWMAVIISISSILLFFFARSWFGTGPALVATLMFEALSMTAHASGFTIQAEHFVILACLGALVSLDVGVRRHSAPLTLLSGALVCWCALVKQNGVFFIGFLLLLTLLYTGPTWKERIKRSLVIAVGMAIPGISIAALMAWEGSFQQLAYWTIEASRYYIGVVPISVAMELFSRTFTQLFLENPVPWLLGGVGAVLLPFGRTARWRRWGIGLFAAFAFMAIIPGFRFFGHYFLLTFPAVALFGAHASYVISSRSIPFIGKADQGLALRTLVLLSVPILAGHWNYYFRPDHVGVLRTVYRTNPFPEARYVADMINAERQEDDGVFVMGSEPQIYVYTGTRSPTRFINMGYLVHEHPMADSLRREAMSDVAKAAPKYVVWVQHLGSWMPGPNADQSFLERYWNTLHEEYDIVAWFEQDPPMQVRIISGEAAKDHRPASELFMFLARRKDIRDAGATVLNGAPPERN